MLEKESNFFQNIFNFFRCEKGFAFFDADSQTITRTKNKNAHPVGWSLLFVVQVTGLDRVLRLRLALYWLAHPTCGAVPGCAALHGKPPAGCFSDRADLLRFKSCRFSTL